jgi:hypothetical protein
MDYVDRLLKALKMKRLGPLGRFFWIKILGGTQDRYRPLEIRGVPGYKFLKSNRTGYWFGLDRDNAVWRVNREALDLMDFADRIDRQMSVMQKSSSEQP